MLLIEVQMQIRAGFDQLRESFLSRLGAVQIEALQLFHAGHMLQPCIRDVDVDEMQEAKSRKSGQMVQSFVRNLWARQPEVLQAWQLAEQFQALVG